MGSMSLRRNSRYLQFAFYGYVLAQSKDSLSQGDTDSRCRLHAPELPKLTTTQFEQI